MVKSIEVNSVQEEKDKPIFEDIEGEQVELEIEGSTFIYHVIND